MTKEDIQILHEEFSRYLAIEQGYREDLLKLRFYGSKASETTEAELAEKLQLHDEMIEAIERNRQENMLPILETLAKFIGAKTREQEQGQLY